MKVFRSDNGCFFNEALIWVERNDGNEVLDSGEIQISMGTEANAVSTSYNSALMLTI
jgi:hypothetical protein